MLKQRLIGAAVVVALAVVLIPMVLNTVGKHNIREIPSTPHYVKYQKASNNLQVHRSLPRYKPRATTNGNNSSSSNSVNNIASKKSSVADYAYSGAYNKAPANSSADKTPGSATTALSAKTGNNKADNKTRAPAVANKHFIQERRGKQRDDNKQKSQSKVYFAKRMTDKPKAVSDKIQLTSASKRLQKRKSAVWSVQIASFNRHGNARVLQSKLEKAGFKAYIMRKKDRKQKNVYRVRIGPALDKNKAKALLVRLKREVRLNGYITSHRQ